MKLCEISKLWSFFRPERGRRGALCLAANPSLSESIEEKKEETIAEEPSSTISPKSLDEHKDTTKEKLEDTTGSSDEVGSITNTIH